MTIFCLCTPFHELLQQCSLLWKWSAYATAGVLWILRLFWLWPSACLYCGVWCLSSSSWKCPRNSLMGFRSGKSSGQSSSKQVSSRLDIVGRCQFLLGEKIISIGMSEDGRIEFFKFSSINFGYDNTQWTIAPQVITDWKCYTGLQWNLILYLANISPDFGRLNSKWNVKFTFMCKEKMTFDQWVTPRFFFSLAQVRCFWYYLWFRSGLTLGHFQSFCLRMVVLNPTSVLFFKKLL